MKVSFHTKIAPDDPTRRSGPRPSALIAPRNDRKKPHSSTSPVDESGMGHTLQARRDRHSVDGEEQRLKMIVRTASQPFMEKNEGDGLSDCYVVTDEDDRMLLSRLLSQLEMIKAGSLPHSSSSVTDPSPSGSSEASKVCTRDEKQSIVDRPVMATEEILRELRNLKRQNRITHWLLSALIVATALCRFSEISLVFFVKQKINHPFKALGNFLFGTLKNPLLDVNNSFEVPNLPQLRKIPDLTQEDMSSFDIRSIGQ